MFATSSCEIGPSSTICAYSQVEPFITTDISMTTSIALLNGLIALYIVFYVFRSK